MSNEGILNEFFDHLELEFIKRQIWWTACQNTHILVKGGVFQEKYLLVITNLKQVWVGKGEKDDIILELKSYNPALECDESQLEQVLKQIHILLSQGSKVLDFNTLDFTLNNTEDMEMKVQYKLEKLIPFKWEFMGYKIPINEAQDLISTDLISSLILTIETQDKRVQKIKSQYEELERQYKNRLSEREKNLFKSKLNDNEENWKYYVKDINQNNQQQNVQIPKLQFSECSEYFFKEYTVQSIPQNIRKKLNYQNVYSQNIHLKQDKKGIDTQTTQNSQIYSQNISQPVSAIKNKPFQRKNYAINQLKFEDNKNQQQQFNQQNDLNQKQEDKKVENNQYNEDNHNNNLDQQNNIAQEDLLDDQVGEMLEKQLKQEIQEKQKKKDEKKKKKKAHFL